MTRQRWARWAGPAAALAFVTACSGDPGRAAEPAPPPSPATPSPTATPQQRLELVRLGSFSRPVWVGPAPGDSRHLYLAESSGRVLRLDRQGRVLGTVLDARERTSRGSEQGLQAIAFDPAFARNKRMYVFLTETDGVNRLLVYPVVGGVAGSPKALLTVERPYPNHNGGMMRFDRAGMLLVALGDGGSAGDPDNRAQFLGVPHGKILRIDPVTGAGAPGNPFPRHPKVWAVGLRNPWRFSFDTNGDLYLGDVGQNRQEELNVVPPAQQAGANYGWPVYEGHLVFREDAFFPVGVVPVEPALTYPHLGGACSITAGEVYRGRRVPSLRGSYVFGDYCLGRLWAVDRTERGVTPLRELGVAVEGLQAFGLDHDGELLALSVDGLHRLVPPPG